VLVVRGEPGIGKTASSASRCGLGIRSSLLSIRPHNWFSAAKGSSISDSTPTARATWKSNAVSAAYFSRRICRRGRLAHVVRDRDDRAFLPFAEDLAARDVA
jgi:hypothetical protein